MITYEELKDFMKHALDEAHSAGLVDEQLPDALSFMLLMYYELYRRPPLDERVSID